MKILELKSICDMFDMDVYDEITLETCVEKRLTTGGPSRTAITQEIEKNDLFLSEYAK